jgi:hypothetical protein
MMEALIAFGLILHVAAWTIFNTRFVVASAHFEMANTRVSAALAALGTLLIGIGILA